MRIKQLALLIITILFISVLSAQQLYMPRNVKEAIKKETRSLDGNPGKKYWQNTANYSIAVKLAPPNKTVTGTETITYTNNSPESLSNLVIKLILNIHKPGAARQNAADMDYLSTGIIIDKYTENGVVKKLKDARANTSQYIPLSKPLASKASVTISFDWHYDVSVKSGREGMLDSTSFFLAYFYPRVAVCDDIHGWDQMIFTDAQEFYNDFNNYDFSVTVPKNYLVWATGELQNINEVLQPDYISKFNAAKTSDKTINVVTQKDIDAKNVTLQKEFNTWKWKAENVSDIAVCVSNHYVWDAASVMVDNKTKRRSLVQAAYLDQSVNFKKSVEYSHHSLDWLSNNWPGVPYPYPSSTVVEGFADMEYPMMANDSHQEEPVIQRFVAEHEIAHTWFPFYMGINEHRYASMDEGWTTAFEYMIGIADLGEEQADNFFKQFRVANWVKDNSDEHQIPIITPGNVLEGAGLGDNEYGKPALAYLALKDMLGDVSFKKALHGFMDRWHGKHPIPWDMFNSFSNITGQDLNWFWNNWFFTNNTIDLAIKNVVNTAKGSTVTIENIGGFAIPTNLLVEYADGSKEKIHQTAAIWKANGALATIQLNSKKKILYLKLDNGIYMDYDETNNAWGKSATPTFDATKTKTGDLDKFLGEYASAKIPVTLKFTKQDKKLFVEVTGQGNLELQQTNTNVFEFTEAGAIFTFDPTKNEVTLQQGVGSYLFTKK